MKIHHHNFAKVKSGVYYAHEANAMWYFMRLQKQINQPIVRARDNNLSRVVTFVLFVQVLRITNASDLFL